MSVKRKKYGWGSFALKKKKKNGGAVHDETCDMIKDKKRVRNLKKKKLACLWERPDNKKAIG